MSSMSLLLADGRLPVGGHAQSAGLEPAVQAGLSREEVPGFLRARLRTTVAVDAGAAVVALHLVRSTGDPAPALRAWEARTPSDVVRRAQVELGRGYGRLLARIGGPVDRSLPRPIALAHLAFRLEVASDDLARVVCHDEVQSVCAAALKLLPLDPLDTVEWALEAAPEVECVVQAVAGLTDPDQIPAATAPAAELWQHAHARTTRRLFRA